MAVFSIQCPHCGTELEVQDEWADMEVNCPFCQGIFIVPRRNPVPNRYAPPSWAASPGASYRSGGNPNGKAVTSMILGAAGLLTGALGLIPGIIAIVFSRKAADEMARTGNYDGRGFATAGMGLGIAGTVLSCIWIIALSLALIGDLDFDDDGGSSSGSSASGKNTHLSFNAEMGRRALDSLPSEQRAALLTGSGSFNDEANALANLSSDDLDGVIEYLQSTSE